MCDQWRGDHVVITTDQWIAEESWGMYGAPDYPVVIEAKRPTLWTIIDELPSFKEQSKTNLTFEPGLTVRTYTDNCIMCGDQTYWRLPLGNDCHTACCEPCYNQTKTPQE